MKRPNRKSVDGVIRRRVVRRTPIRAKSKKSKRSISLRAVPYVFALIIILVLLYGITYNVMPQSAIVITPPTLRFWDVQSVDTMKYSRDLAREKLYDPSFDKVIDEQIGNIAAMGATHVAIATPYDNEFDPIRIRWVAAARDHDLNVWFRGNWSGWEEWFDYGKITRTQHIQKTERFIRKYAQLFEDGDIFTACMECENGGPGDPRSINDAEGHRNFLLREHSVLTAAFAAIDKDVIVNYNSMNGDVARLIMDKETTEALGGVVTIDHYVKTADQLAQDVAQYVKESEGKIVLGEFGAPIPDIHGDFSEVEQSAWVKNALDQIAQNDEVIALNYWVNVGGSTPLWNNDGTPRLVQSTLSKFYNAETLYGFVYDELGRPIRDATVTSQHRIVTTDYNGYFQLPVIFERLQELHIQAKSYIESDQAIVMRDEALKFTLIKERKGPIFRSLQLLQAIGKAFAQT